MNKKFITILLIIAVVIGCVGIFAACNGGNDLAFNGIDGYDVKIDHSAKTATVDVDCYTVSISLSKFKVSKNAELKVYINENLSDEIVDALTLDYGANVFYVNVSNGDKNLTYTLTVSRAKPSDTLDENKTVKSIEIIHWKDTYVVGEKFSVGILKVTYTDGSTQSLAMSLNMVSGFSTKAVGEFEVTITVKTINIKHKFTVVGASIPEYNRPGTADLDVDTFVDAICQYVAMVCTMHMTGSEHYQEEYQRSFSYYKLRHTDDFEFMAQCVSECGMGTAAFNQLTTSLTAALTDIGQIMKDINAKVDNPIWGNEARLDRIRTNASKVISLLKPEQVSMLAIEKTDLIMRRFNEDSMYDKYVELLDVAKKAGDTELATALEKRVKEYDSLKLDYLEVSQFILGEYNSLVYGVYNMFAMIDTVLNCDSKALYKAAACIMDIIDSISNDEEKLSDLLAGKGKYSYREMVEHANFIGDLILKAMDANGNLSLMASLLFERMDKFNFWQFIFLDSYLTYDVYRVLGEMLKNITTTDLTDIYMDYNDYVVALNNNLQETVIDAKFATLAVRLAKLLDDGILCSGADRDVVANGIAGWYVGYTSYEIKVNAQFCSENLVALLDIAHSVSEPTKLSEEQVKIIVDKAEKIINSGLSAGFTGEILSYGIDGYMYPYDIVLNIDVGDDKESVVELLKEEVIDSDYDLYKYTLKDGVIESSEIVDVSKITLDTIKNLDWSTTGYKKAKIEIDGLEYELRYIVTADLKPIDKYALRIPYDGWRFLGAFEIGDVITLEDALSDGMYIEYCNSENTLERIVIRASECTNLKLLGVDTATVGEKYAYVIGDSEFGKQIFPVRYVVIDANNPFVSEIQLISENNRNYKVGDKFEGYLRVEYNGDYNNEERKELDESKLTYDFSTPGYKKVTYTYENKQYATYVNVYGESMAKNVDYVGFTVSHGIKGDEMVFQDLSIEFYCHQRISMTYCTLDQMKAELQKVSPEYDVIVTVVSRLEFGIGMESVHYKLIIVRNGATLYQRTFSIMEKDLSYKTDELKITLRVDILTNEIKYAEVLFNIGIRTCVTYADLLKYGELTKIDDDQYTFESPYCDNCYVTVDYYM